MAYMNCRFYSKYLAHSTEVMIALPDAWEDRPSGGYPVLYLLHGRGDDCSSWMRFSSIERYAGEYQIAVIMPSAETSFYVDGVYGKRYFSYMTQELPKVMESWFPLTKDPAGTYIAGLSMGGYGALKIGLSYPERFARIGIFSAGIRPDQIPDYGETDTENDILHEDLKQAFGNGPLPGQDDPEALIRVCQAEGKHLPGIIHYEGTQDFLYKMNDAFRSFAQGQKLDYIYEEWDGVHDWIFWDQAIQKMLKKIFRDNNGII